MKLNALQSFSPKATTPNKNQKYSSNPSFGAAKVNLIKDTVDTISSYSVSLSDGRLNTLAEKIVPLLQKFDDNLIFTVSPTKQNGFLSIFRDVLGLKVDIRYFDQKKAYIDILNKTPNEQLLRQETLNGLKAKDHGLLCQLAEKIGVGKLFRPKTESEDRYVETLVNMIKEDIIRMPKRLLENKNITKEPDGRFTVTSGPLFWKGSDNRNVWAWYRGIEY